MRSLSVALLFGLIMMVSMLHGGAVKEEDEQRAKGKRYLLSETDLGRKGIRSDRIEPARKGSASANTNTASVNGNKASYNDDINESYENNGNGSVPVLNSHHYFHIRTPPIHG
ncbi:hypothetical protein LR48_Vigan09g170600 [Vigna angularis]|uniref:Uncharacterized protein n=2 Tax=Phaseolus angularis TaxID=3914 RepID=A0A0L9VDQ7_PHAAN|nr:uncharacterized protein HKW66_Vig0072140 [Vigna angularis]KOM53047.1 hypothetical protein LR48_Vigan09g170600 [Vigna angularis]BAT87772.1 hypothetical protein VIGAN_05117400 [Vigna angularis var. angularis]